MTSACYLGAPSWGLALARAARGFWDQPCAPSVLPRTCRDGMVPAQVALPEVEKEVPEWKVLKPIH